MGFTKRLFINLLIFSFIGIPSYASVLSVPLKELAQESDTIVVGKVLKVTTFERQSPQEDVKIAKLEITQTIKGSINQTHLYYWASPTWDCDISEAKEGEIVLLLLQRASQDWLSDSSVFSQKSPSLAESLRQHIQNNPMFFIAHSGGGRMRIEDKLTDRNSHVEYPEEIRIIKRREARYRYESFSLLDVVIKYIKRQI